jgi:hypothetical protein
MAIAVRVDTNSEDSAAKAVAMIQGQLPQVSGPMSQFGLSKAAKSITVVQEKAAFKLGVTLTEAEINALLNLASGFTGGGATPAPAPAAPAPAPMAPKKTK